MFLEKILQRIPETGNVWKDKVQKRSTFFSFVAFVNLIEISWRCVYICFFTGSRKMSGPYKPQARLDRDLLRHLHRRLACGSSHPTPLDGEKYGAWHTRMTKDLQQSRAEDAEEWRKQNGPWHAHEIREWMEQMRGDPRATAGPHGVGWPDSTSSPVEWQHGVGWPSDNGVPASHGPAGVPHNVGWPPRTGAPPDAPPGVGPLYGASPGVAWPTAGKGETMGSSQSGVPQVSHGSAATPPGVARSGCTNAGHCPVSGATQTGCAPGSKNLGEDIWTFCVLISESWRHLKKRAIFGE